ncbi:DUF1836 domain-containing protein [Psychrobacillus vulpis]|uniref:DUF1836 domain-containing protein n=1 Tax=Psychrobacillus vulpis TaxID=2325572 RepID=A0A544TTL0_9BACI|nr:DUF1836 domain-containing protein [Psychrobacillus vulpis]TQR20740.1 DUF1836 domain-containing protein [Psychrobacillus vulpis]
MIQSEELLQKLSLESTIKEEEIPEIDLYMDQVIQLFDSKFAKTLRNDEEKVLTKTMINNYAKGKLFIPIKNKKYSKQHIMLISMIYQLKGTLSINDIKATLDPINKRLESENFELEQFYSTLVHLQKKNAENISKQIRILEKEIELEEAQEELKQISFIASLASMSNAFRKAAEIMVDGLLENNKEDKKK